MQQCHEARGLITLHDFMKPVIISFNHSHNAERKKFMHITGEKSKRGKCSIFANNKN